MKSILVSKAVEKYLKENFGIEHEYTSDSKTTLHFEPDFDVTGSAPSGYPHKNIENFDEIIKLNFDEQAFVCKLLAHNNHSSLKINRTDKEELLNVLNKLLAVYRSNVDTKVMQEKFAKILYEDKNDWNLSNYYLLDYDPNQEKESLDNSVSYYRAIQEEIELIKNALDSKLKETEELNEALKTKISTEKSVDILKKQIEGYKASQIFFGSAIVVMVISTISIVVSIILEVDPENLNKIFELDVSRIFIFTTVITLFTYLLNFLVKNYNNSMAMLENKKEKLNSMEIFLSLSASDIELGADLEQARKKMIAEILTIKSNNWDKHDDSKISTDVLSKLIK